MKYKCNFCGHIFGVLKNKIFQNTKILMIFVVLFVLSIGMVSAINYDNIIHGYMYNNCSGVDIGNNPIDLAVIGTPFDNPLVLGSGCSFNKSDYMYNNNFTETTEIKTIELWFNHTSSVGGLVLDMNNLTWGTNIMIWGIADVEGTESLYSYIFDENSSTLIDGGTLESVTRNNLHQVIISITSDNRLSLYVDGVYKSQFNVSVSSLPLFTQLSLNQRTAGGLDTGADGMTMSRITFFNETFNDSLATESYNSGLGVDWITYDTESLGCSVTNMTLISYNATDIIYTVTDSCNNSELSCYYALEVYPQEAYTFMNSNYNVNIIDFTTQFTISNINDSIPMGYDGSYYVTQLACSDTDDSEYTDIGGFTYIIPEEPQEPIDITGQVVNNVATGITNIFVAMLITMLVIIIGGSLAVKSGVVEQQNMLKIMAIALIGLAIVMMIIAFNMFVLT